MLSFTDRHRGFALGVAAAAGCITIAATSTAAADISTRPDGCNVTVVSVAGADIPQDGEVAFMADLNNGLGPYVLANKPVKRGIGTEYRHTHGALGDHDSIQYSVLAEWTNGIGIVHTLPGAIRTYGGGSGCSPGPLPMHAN